MRKLAVLALLCISSSLFAATRLVTVAGTDAGDCTVAPCATLNYAIGQAVDGDTIDVGPGTFNNGGANVNVIKTLTIIGEQAGVDARTRVATESILTVPVLMSEDDIVLDGFTVTCGACTGIGAGVVTSASFSGYQVLNNIVTGNPIGMYPGSNGTNPSLIQFNNIFDNNEPGAAGGTGIYTDTGVTNYTIDQNRLSGQETAQMNIIGSATLANVTISNNTFPLDTVDDANAVVLFSNNGTQILNNVVTGGAFSAFFIGGNDDNILIDGNVVTGSVSNAVSISDVGFGANGGVTVTGNHFLNNLRGVSVGAGNQEPIEVHNNRIVNNTTDIRTTATPATVNAENNWWGCNEGPATCATTSIFAGSTIDLDPWLVMDINASPSSITIAQTSNVTSDFLQSSDGLPVAGFFVDDIAVVSFSAASGTMTPPTDPTTGGSASSVFDPAVTGTIAVSATLDDETVSTNVIVSALTTTVVLTSDNNPSDFGENVTFTATLDPAATGTVQFFDGATPLGTVPVAAGSAQLTTNTLIVGSHNITAVYSGDVNFASATSNTVVQVVNLATTTVVLTSDNNPSDFGENVTFTATVNPAATGTVQFFDFGVPLGASVPLAGGVAQFTTNTLSVGSHNITAVYSGDANFSSATSNTLVQVVLGGAAGAPTLSGLMLMLFAAAIGIAGMMMLKR